MIHPRLPSCSPLVARKDQHLRRRLRIRAIQGSGEGVLHQSYTHRVLNDRGVGGTEFSSCSGVRGDTR